MRKNFGAKPWTYPQPVYIIATYDKKQIPNAMNAAWGGISGFREISMCLSPAHKTVKNILERKAFTVSIGDADHMVECDYVGIVSGNAVSDKFSKCGFTQIKSEFVDAPIIKELPMALECRLKSYNDNTHILIGEVLNVNADERILDDRGNIDPLKFQPIIFDPVNNHYYAIGEKIGNAFQDGNKIEDKS